MAEEGTKNEEISDAERIVKAMDAACEKMDAISGRLDRMDARMDAMEMMDKKDSRRKDGEEGDKREEEKDSRRKDAEGEESFKKWAKEEEKEPEHKDSKKDSKKDGEEEGGEKGKPEEVAADKKRKDAEEEKEEKKEEAKDSRRKDEDEEEKEEKREDARADAALRGQVSDLQAQIKRLESRVPALLSDSDRERFAAIQERADSAFQAFGERAPGPLDGESPVQYKRRLASKMQGHSPKWKDARLSAVADEAILDTVVGEIYADSIQAAKAGADVGEGRLVPVMTRTDAGHTHITWRGDPKAMSRQFSGRAMRAGGTKR